MLDTEYNRSIQAKIERNNRRSIANIDALNGAYICDNCNQASYPSHQGGKINIHSFVNGLKSIGHELAPIAKPIIEEGVKQMIDRQIGGKINISKGLRNFGNSVVHGLAPVAKALAPIAKPIIEEGASVAGTAIGTELGNPFLGEIAGHAVGNMINNKLAGGKVRSYKKGTRSKTRKNDLDFTTKQGDIDYHEGGHDQSKDIVPYSGGKVSGGSPWIQHVKAFAQQNNLKYKDALSNPECKSSYHSAKTGGKLLSKKNIGKAIGLGALGAVALKAGYNMGTVNRALHHTVTGKGLNMKKVGKKLKTVALVTAGLAGAVGVGAYAGRKHYEHENGLKSNHFGAEAVKGLLLPNNKAKK